MSIAPNIRMLYYQFLSNNWNWAYSDPQAYDPYYYNIDARYYSESEDDFCVWYVKNVLCVGNK